MSMIVWILPGLGLGLIASKIVSVTGQGTVVDILLGIVGAAVGGWLLNLFGVTCFDIDSFYSAGAAVIGAIILIRFLPPPNAMISTDYAYEPVSHFVWSCVALVPPLRRSSRVLALVPVAYCCGDAGRMVVSFIHSWSEPS